MVQGWTLPDHLQETVMRLDEDDAPDWSFWRQVPTLTLEEAVSLSLNIDPRKLVTHPAGGGCAGIAISRILPPEFYRQLDLATRCIGETLPAAKSRYGKEHVRLYSFTRWAAGIGWDLPSALQNLTREVELSGAMEKSSVGESEPLRIEAVTAGLALPPANNKPETEPEQAPTINRLAEWIFNMRHQEHRFQQLYNIARKDDQLGTFTKTDFLREYQAVYMTSAHRSPATGWPLQPVYQKRAEDEKIQK
jgi:hypothetical protein